MCSKRLRRPKLRITCERSFGSRAAVTNPNRTNINPTDKLFEDEGGSAKRVQMNALTSATPVSAVISKFRGMMMGYNGGTIQDHRSHTTRITPSGVVAGSPLMLNARCEHNRKFGYRTGWMKTHRAFGWDSRVGTCFTSPRDNRPRC